MSAGPEPCVSEQPVGMAVEAFADELRAPGGGGWGGRRRSWASEWGIRGRMCPAWRRWAGPTLVFAKKADEAMATPGTFARLHGQINREAFPPWFTLFVQFEERAARIHNWDQRCLTGLIQTGEYARAIITSGRPDLSGDAVEHDVAARMQRQQVLDREDPPFCWFIIGEAALRTPFGGPQVMRGQLAKLAGYASRPRITVQVFPFASADCRGRRARVTIFDFADALSVGYAEGY